MTRYPDYRMAYWKDYTYVQGYMFEAMDRLGQLTGGSRYLEYIRNIWIISLMKRVITKEAD